MKTSYDSFVSYMEAVKRELLSRVEMTPEEADVVAETFGDYFEDEVDPATAVDETLRRIAENKDCDTDCEGETPR